MACSGNDTASACHRWRERWSLVWRESVASQDHAREVQIRHSFDYGYASWASCLPDDKGLM